MIEDPVEIIDNERELKGFYNMDEVIKLVGYFKSEKSPRRLRPWPRPSIFDLSRHGENCCYAELFPTAFLPDFIEYDDAAEEFHPFVKFFATFDPKVVVFFLITDYYYFYWLILRLRFFFFFFLICIHWLVA